LCCTTLRTNFFLGVSPVAEYVFPPLARLLLYIPPIVVLWVSSLGVLLLNIFSFGALLLNIPPLAVLILNSPFLAVLLLIFPVLLLNIPPLTARLAALLLNQSVRLIYIPFCSAAAQYSSPNSPSSRALAQSVSAANLYFFLQLCCSIFLSLQHCCSVPPLAVLLLNIPLLAVLLLSSSPCIASAQYSSP
jgi:hypothetical protein